MQMWAYLQAGLLQSTGPLNLKHGRVLNLLPVACVPPVGDFPVWVALATTVVIHKVDKVSPKLTVG